MTFSVCFLIIGSHFLHTEGIKILIALTKRFHRGAVKARQEPAVGNGVPRDFRHLARSAAEQEHDLHKELLRLVSKSQAQHLLGDDTAPLNCQVVHRSRSLLESRIVRAAFISYNKHH